MFAVCLILNYFTVTSQLTVPPNAVNFFVVLIYLFSIFPLNIHTSELLLVYKEQNHRIQNIALIKNYRKEKSVHYRTIHKSNFLSVARVCPAVTANCPKAYMSSCNMDINDFLFPESIQELVTFKNKYI